MKKYALTAALLLAATAALAVLSALCLPDTVTTQISLGGGAASVMPKAVAVALPALLGAGGAAALLFPGTDEKTKNRFTVVSIAGIAVFVIMLIVNL